MKKFLLLTIAIILIVQLHSQDVYSAGSFVNDNGTLSAAVFKNDAVIYAKKQLGRDLYSSAIAIDTVSGDIYWAANANPLSSISDGYGYVMKNDEIFLQNTHGTCINDIELDGDDVYSAGYMNDIYNAVAAVWKNDDVTPLYTYASDKIRSYVLDIDVVDGMVYACGYYEDGLNYGCVWVNGSVFAIYTGSKVANIEYKDGFIYYTVTDCLTTIYKSGAAQYELYEYGHGACNEVNGMVLADDDVYSIGFLGFNDCIVWKNADLFYSHPYSRDASLNAGFYYDNSLYYVGYDHESNGIIFKDGEQIHSLPNCALYDVWVMPNPLAVEEVADSNSSVVFIYNVLGSLVKTVRSDDGSINTDDLPSGVYIAKRGGEVTKFFLTKE